MIQGSSDDSRKCKMLAVLVIFLSSSPDSCSTFSTLALCSWSLYGRYHRSSLPSGFQLDLTNGETQWQIKGEKLEGCFLPGVFFLRSSWVSCVPCPKVTVLLNILLCNFLCFQVPINSLFLYLLIPSGLVEIAKTICNRAKRFLHPVQTFVFLPFVNHTSSNYLNWNVPSVFSWDLDSCTYFSLFICICHF